MKKTVKGKILIVDNEVFIIQSFERLLSQASYQVLTAQNGSDALSLIYNEKPQLVLLDVMLPDISGFEVLKKIKSDPATSSVFVALISTLSISGDHQLAELDSEADGYLTKPIQDHELVARIDVFMRHKNTIDDLQKSKARITALINAVPDMMFIVNKDGVFIEYYCTKYEVLYVPPEVFIGKNITEVLPLEIANEITKAFKKAIQSKEVEVLEYSMSLPQGNGYFEARIIAYENDKILCIVRNITDRKEAEQTIKNQNLELKKLNTDKDRFISILAHDLKNPFYTLLGFSKLLSKNIRKYDINKIEQQIGFIFETVKQTNNLLDDLLSWARLQSGRFPFEPRNINFSGIFREIEENLKQIAIAKSITMSYFETAEIAVFADLNMLKTIMRNLISNAIKFTRNQGKIFIYAEQNQIETTITVSDSGVGIAPGDLDKLFDITQNYSTTGTANEKGTGFGLTLCKEFIEKHGGKIWVGSEPGKGSDFKFTLPTFKQ
jgi:signal transduction histidine kinase/CheY-like chemotaxis protein